MKWWKLRNESIGVDDWWLMIDGLMMMMIDDFERNSEKLIFEKTFRTEIVNSFFENLVTKKLPFKKIEKKWSLFNW